MNTFLLIFAALANAISGFGAILWLCSNRYNGQDTAVEKFFFLLMAIGNAITLYLLWK